MDVANLWLIFALGFAIVGFFVLDDSPKAGFACFVLAILCAAVLTWLSLNTQQPGGSSNPSLESEPEDASTPTG